MSVIEIIDIIEFGIKENKLVIIVLCLKTSNINGHPREVLITKTVHKSNMKVSGTCSCKASTTKCKHVGILLKYQKLVKCILLIIVRHFILFIYLCLTV